MANVLHIHCRALGLRAAVDHMVATTWQPTTLVKCISLEPWLSYPGCDGSGGCHDLTLGRIYEMLGVEAKGAFYRILDDSGDDYLYPASHFQPI
ncbi:MAG: hypothetical protein M3Z05_04435 [Gemmatimonadota bacterium]|nr:hypothetical protein [Gemmatimonadota bacterium]